MADIQSAQKGLYLGAILFGLVAVVAGLAGLFVVLTGGGPGQTPASEVLDEFACADEDRDVPFPGETDYGVTARSTSADGIASVNGSTDADGYRLAVTVEETVLNSLTWSFENEPGPEFSEEGKTVTVNGTGSEPFRLWIDTVTEEGDVIRQQLDVCPPAT
ncbi:MAG: hypothetical protein V5A55_04565 [Halovenus sp.]